MANGCSSLRRGYGANILATSHIHLSEESSTTFKNSSVSFEAALMRF